MKLYILAALALLPGAVITAAPADRAIMAAMRLVDQRNYSWTTSVQDDVRSYEIAGRTTEAGYTWVRLPMVKALAVRLGRAVEPDIEAVFRGSGNCVIRADGEWRTLNELPQRHPDWIERDYWLLRRSRLSLQTPILGSGGGFTSPRDPFANDPFLSRRAVPRLEPEEQQPYSNAQFGLSHPHDELAVIISSHESMDVHGDTVTGRLSDLGAQLLLVREGQDDIQPVVAGGMFQLSIRDGIVTSYDLQLEGILIVNDRRVQVRQNSRTNIRQIGSTQMEVPVEALRLLEGGRLLSHLKTRR